MKTIQLTALFLLIPIVFFAQTLTGLWIGNVTNDSNTIRKDQSFEIVLTQYKNKVYGYSRSTFIVNDSLFYVVKRVKGTIEADVCEVKDDEVVSYNFHGRLDKGVKMTTNFRFDHNDSVWRMDGDWKTNKTKKYYAISGKATLSQEKDLTKSKILPHLEELKLADDVEFYKESKKAQEAVAVAQADKSSNNERSKSTDIAKNQSAVNSNEQRSIASNDPKPKQAVSTVQQKPEPIVETKQSSAAKEKPVVAIADDNRTNDAVAQAKSQSASGNQQNPGNETRNLAGPSSNGKNNNGSIQANSTSVAVNNTAVTQKPATVAEQKAVEQEKNNNNGTLTSVKPVETKREMNPESSKSQITTSGPATKDAMTAIRENKPVVAPVVAATMVKERKMAAPQIVNFKSDSLLLSLYDNGEVDGDTVSVLLDGEIIIAKQELKVSAIKKTIYIPEGKGDSITLVLYAENLGKYPPNTGLLIVHDGDQSYQIRFSADLQQNAAVIFKRKRN